MLSSPAPMVTYEHKISIWPHARCLQPTSSCYPCHDFRKFPSYKTTISTLESTTYTIWIVTLPLCNNLSLAPLAPSLQTVSTHSNTPLALPPAVARPSIATAYNCATLLRTAFHPSLTPPRASGRPSHLRIIQEAAVSVYDTYTLRIASLPTTCHGLKFYKNCLVSFTISFTNHLLLFIHLPSISYYVSSLYIFIYWVSH